MVKGLPKYKSGKQTEPIELNFMKEIIEKGIFKKQSHKSFLAFLYLTGVRRSETLERIPKDFIKDSSFLTINFPPVKRGLPHTIKLSLDLPFVNLITEQIEKTKPNRKIWDLKRTTADNIVKRAMGQKYYPHFLRLNRNVHFLNDPTTTDPELQSWFGVKRVSSWKESYMGYTQRHIDKQAERLKQQI